MLKIWFAAAILCANLFANYTTSGEQLPFHAARGFQPLGANPGPNSVQQRGFWQYQIPDNNPIFPIPNRPNSHYMILGPGDYQTQPHVSNLLPKNPRQQPFYLPDSMSPRDAFGNLPGYLVFVYQPPELYHEMQSSSQLVKVPPKKLRKVDVIEEDDFDMGDLIQFHIECEKVNPNEKGAIRVEGFDFACRYSKKQFENQKKRANVVPIKKVISRITPKLIPKITPKPTMKSTPKPVTRAVKKPAPPPPPPPPPTKATPKPTPKLRPTPKVKPTPIPKAKPVEKIKRKTQVKPTRKIEKKAPAKQRQLPQKKRNIRPGKGQRKPRSVPNDESTQTNDERLRKLSLEYSYETKENDVKKKPYMEFLVHQFLTKIIYKNADGTISAPNHFYLECNKRKVALQNGIYDFYCTPLKILDEANTPQVRTSTTTILSILPSSPDSSDLPKMHVHGGKGSRSTSTTPNQPSANKGLRSLDVERN